MPAPGLASERASEPLVAPEVVPEGPARRTEGAHLLALDGLRGVAVLAVIVYHFAAAALTYARAIDDKIGVLGLWAFKFFLFGRSGVDLFFVLSGYLITGNLLRAVGRPGYFRVFYWRRFLRIFPAYYLWLTILAVLIVKVLPSEGAGASPHWQWWFWTYLSNRLMAAHQWGGAPQLLRHFWSLAVEEQFYLLWPALIFVVRARRAALACLFFMIGCLAYRAYLVSHGNVAGAYMLTEARMDSLAAGGLLATAALNPAGVRPYVKRLWAVGTVSAAIILALCASDDGFPVGDPLVVTLGYTALALCCMALIGLATRPPAESFVTRAMSVRPLRFLGRYSYGIYLIHHPLIFVLWRTGVVDRAWALLPSWMPFTPSMMLVSFVFPGILSVALAMASWHGFEQPLLRFKGRVTYG